MTWPLLAVSMALLATQVACLTPHQRELAWALQPGRLQFLLRPSVPERQLDAVLDALCGDYQLNRFDLEIKGGVRHPEDDPPPVWTQGDLKAVLAAGGRARASMDPDLRDLGACVQAFAAVYLTPREGFAGFVGDSTLDRGSAGAAFLYSRHGPPGVRFGKLTEPEINALYAWITAMRRSGDPWQRENAWSICLWFAQAANQDKWNADLWRDGLPDDIAGLMLRALVARFHGMWMTDSSGKVLTMYSDPAGLDVWVVHALSAAAGPDLHATGLDGRAMRCSEDPRPTTYFCLNQ